MRFMLLMIPKGYETAAPDTIPDDAAALETELWAHLMTQVKQDG